MTIALLVVILIVAAISMVFNIARDRQRCGGIPGIIEAVASRRNRVAIEQVYQPAAGTPRATPPAVWPQLP
jgi:hypothetical protein